MTDAVIVSTARTGLTKSWKGSFNMTHGATLGGHVLQAAIARAGIEAGELEIPDVPRAAEQRGPRAAVRRRRS